jgi:hypothetical protein
MSAGPVEVAVGSPIPLGETQAGIRPGPDTVPHAKSGGWDRGRRPNRPHVTRILAAVLVLATVTVLGSGTPAHGWPCENPPSWNPADCATTTTTTTATTQPTTTTTVELAPPVSVTQPAPPPPTRHPTTALARTGTATDALLGIALAGIATGLAFIIAAPRRTRNTR